MEDVAKVINAHIAKEFMFNDPQGLLGNDLPLIEHGIIDSLGIFVLIAFLEKEFEIKIQPEDVVLQNFETVNAISGLVMSKR